MRVVIRVILIVCVVLLGAFLCRGYFMLKDKTAQTKANAQKIEALKDDIKSEEEKVSELKKNNKSKDVTDEDYEAIARQEFGLIKKDEIVIKPR